MLVVRPAYSVPGTVCLRDSASHMTAFHWSERPDDWDSIASVASITIVRLVQVAGLKDRLCLDQVALLEKTKLAELRPPVDFCINNASGHCGWQAGSAERVETQAE